MDVHKIKSILVDYFLPEKIYVNKDDTSHYRIVIVSDQFVNLNRLEREKLIYVPLMEYIVNGCIHSLSLQVFTVLEWEYECSNSMKLV